MEQCRAAASHKSLQAPASPHDLLGRAVQHEHGAARKVGCRERAGQVVELGARGIQVVVERPLPAHEGKLALWRLPPASVTHQPFEHELCHRLAAELLADQKLREDAASFAAQDFERQGGLQALRAARVREDAEGALARLHDQAPGHEVVFPPELERVVGQAVRDASRAGTRERNRGATLLQMRRQHVGRIAILLEDEQRPAAGHEVSQRRVRAASHDGHLILSAQAVQCMRPDNENASPAAADFCQILKPNRLDGSLPQHVQQVPGHSVHGQLRAGRDGEPVRRTRIDRDVGCGPVDRASAALDDQLELHVGRRTYVGGRELDGRLDALGRPEGELALPLHFAAEPPDERQVRRAQRVVVEEDGALDPLAAVEPAPVLLHEGGVGLVSLADGQVLLVGERPALPQRPRARARDFRRAVCLDLHLPGPCLARAQALPQAPVRLVAQEGRQSVGRAGRHPEELADVERLAAVPLPLAAGPAGHARPLVDPVARVRIQRLLGELVRVVQVDHVRRAVGVFVAVVHDGPRGVQGLDEPAQLAQPHLGPRHAVAADVQYLVLDAVHDDGRMVLVAADDAVPVLAGVLPELLALQRVVAGEAPDRRLLDDGQADLVGHVVPVLGPDVGVQAHRHAVGAADGGVLLPDLLVGQQAAAGRMSGRGKELHPHAVEHEVDAVRPELAEAEPRARRVHRLAVGNEPALQVIEVRRVGHPELRRRPGAGQCALGRRPGLDRDGFRAQLQHGAAFVRDLGAQRHLARPRAQIPQDVRRLDSLLTHGRDDGHVLDEDVVADHQVHVLPDAEQGRLRADRRHHPSLDGLDQVPSRPVLDLPIDEGANVLHPYEQLVRPVRTAGVGHLQLERLPSAVMRADMPPVDVDVAGELHPAEGEEDVSAPGRRRQLERAPIPRIRRRRLGNVRRDGDRFPVSAELRTLCRCRALHLPDAVQGLHTIRSGHRASHQRQDCSEQASGHRFFPFSGRFSRSPAAALR